nr:uncharacterized protein ywbe [Quercus suber]
MHRPRNRQTRTPRDKTDGVQQRNRHTTSLGQHSSYNNVPGVRQVVPGAAVSIVLKADQPTGREVQGIVQDLLTRSDHPRGIKVRLQDGRIGRVQRMAGQHASAGPSHSLPLVDRNSKDDRYDNQYLSEPPPRSLADFLPPSAPQAPASAPAVSTCPICGMFEGDEAAVTHHVDEHLR